MPASERAFQPPFDVEQDPPLAGVMRYRFQQQIMGNGVEEGPVGFQKSA
jgi:hypothetical protein